MNRSPRDAPVRVKLFALSRDNVWDDVGVGYIDSVPQQELVITRDVDSSDDEDQPSEMLRIDLRNVVNYPMENNSILTLELPEESYAISFKSDSFEAIQRLRDFIHALHYEQLMPRNGNLRLIQLELTKTPKVIVDLASSNPHFLESLRRLFEQTELREGALEEHPDLVRIFDVVKRLLNDGQQLLLLRLISDQIFPMVLGAMQYNPMTTAKRDFRQEFKLIRFHNILGLPEELIEEFVTPNMRLHYLRDCVVATFIEPTAEIQFTNICLANTACLLTYICARGLFPKLVEHFHDHLDYSVGLLEETCVFLKSAKVELKQRIVDQLMRVNVFSVIHMCLEEILPKGTVHNSVEQFSLVERLLDIMASLALADNRYFERFLLENHQACLESLEPHKYDFCSYAVYLLREGTYSAKFNLISLFTNLLTLEEGREKSEVLLGLLERNLIKPATQQSIKLQGYHPCDSLRLLCDFLGGIYSLMPLRVRRCIIETQLLKHLTTMLFDKKLLLATVRLIKILVESKDPHIHRYLLKNDLFRNLEQAYRQNLKRRSNVVESAFKNFFSCVSNQHLQISPQLVRHLVELFDINLVLQQPSVDLCVVQSLKDIP